jgi:hypothetical protein
MDFWILRTFFVTPTKVMDMYFYFTCVSLNVFETLGYWMNYVLINKDPLNEWNVILIYYVMDIINPKDCNDFKSPFKHLKTIILCFFNMYYNIIIWNWKWKKKLLSISSKYSYFKLLFNYNKKGLWKGTLIRQN